MISFSMDSPAVTFCTRVVSSDVIENTSSSLRFVPIMHKASYCRFVR